MSTRKPRGDTSRSQKSVFVGHRRQAGDGGFIRGIPGGGFHICSELARLERRHPLKVSRGDFSQANGKLVFGQTRQSLSQLINRIVLHRTRAVSTRIPDFKSKTL